MKIKKVEEEEEVQFTLRSSSQPETFKSAENQFMWNRTALGKSFYLGLDLPCVEKVC